jgi:hypothetical protein
LVRLSIDEKEMVSENNIVDGSKTGENNEGVLFQDDIMTNSTMETTGPRVPTNSKDRFDWNDQSTTLEDASLETKDDEQAVVEDEERSRVTPSDITAAIKASAKIDRSVPKEKASAKSQYTDVRKDGLRGSSRDDSDNISVIEKSHSDSKSMEGTFEGEYSIMDEEKVPKIVWLMSFPNSVRLPVVCLTPLIECIAKRRSY